MVSKEFLDLRTHVGGIRAYNQNINGTSQPSLPFLSEQDLHKLSKRDSTEVRI
jgi:hypothetical protein